MGLADLYPPLRPIAAIWARFRLTAEPPLRPAARASSTVNSCAVPLRCAACPPCRAISRCLSRDIAAKPYLPLFIILLDSCSGSGKRDIYSNRRIQSENILSHQLTAGGLCQVGAPSQDC